MRERYKNALMWALYAALVLFVLVVQTVSFGRPRFFGVKLCFVPVLVACVSMHVGSEAGGVFGMACGLLWALSGADGGALHIVLLAGCGLRVSVRPVSGAQSRFCASDEPAVPDFLPAGALFLQMYRNFHRHAGDASGAGAGGAVSSSVSAGLPCRMGNPKGRCLIFG